MKVSISEKRSPGLTLIEVLAVLAALVILAVIFLPAFFPRPLSRERVMRIRCVNNLKQIGLACRVWEGDNSDDMFPMFVSQTNGGTREFTTGANAWRHFQVMSNELSTPKVLYCPAESDSQRFVATNFTWLNNSNLSVFVGIIPHEANPRMILSGDRNLTNGAAIKNGLLGLSAGQPLGWTAEMHNQVGNLCLADGSVQQLSSAGLQNAIVNTSVATNLIQMPVLGP